MRGCRRPTPHTTLDHRILFNHTVCASVNPMWSSVLKWTSHGRKIQVATTSNGFFASPSAGVPPVK